jgi:hypothetical protein
MKVELSYADAKMKLDTYGSEDCYIEVTATNKSFETYKPVYMYRLIVMCVVWYIGKRIGNKLINEGYAVVYQ